jgi:hypothetical protein
MVSALVPTRAAHMNSLALRATRRFVEGYDRAQPLRKACAIGAVADLRRAFQSDGRSFLRKYNKVKGLAPAVWEMDISGAERLLFHCRDRTVHLLAMGGHEIVEHYKKTAALETELQNARSLPPALERLASAGFFTFDVESEWRQFADEADPSWLTALDKQQHAAVKRILKRVNENEANQRAWCFYLIVGGPGTGKTSVLLNLFSRALEQNIVPQIVVEDQVAEFVRDSGGLNLDACRVSLYQADALSEGGVLLIDDPQFVNQIQHAKVLAQLRRFRAVVVAVDPLQLAEDATDHELQLLRSGAGTEAITLQTCYRQKEVVGQAAKRALDTIAQSSPFLREDKKADFASARAEITRTCNDLTFTNPSGRAKVYAPASLANIQAEVRRLKRAPGLWRHAAPYLIAQDDEWLVKLPPGWKSSLEELRDARWIGMRGALGIKGIEFQHVILILSESLFLQLENGFEGATRALYNQRRLYRIPLSRAKDSITVFVVRSGPGTDLS